MTIAEKNKILQFLITEHEKWKTVRETAWGYIDETAEAYMKGWENALMYVSDFMDYEYIQEKD